MGNCQAIDAAALVIQHPCGRIERLYWPVTASEVIRTNPGHYVALIIPLPTNPGGEDSNGKQHPSDDHDKVRFTQVKLLRPSETLTLGHAYRLITSQEVMKVLRAKRHAKMKQQQHSHQQSAENSSHEEETSSQTRPDASDREKSNQRTGGGTLSINSVAVRPKSWRPSLHSIAEVAS
ncbi:uncharacterized protein LOC116199941 [Punica granatum]|uniref:Uncharacterized protein LOC116199941 n=1 Tax=Punica granatum TaxID=22663 RepID=A0A218XXQ7_PUNGR|nr:uncharacterized protein LOC116199941 [Punica granatum]OWM89620.1 hypothetical protein CDL15_Pgr024368 [Punica granatum]